MASADPGAAATPVCSVAYSTVNEWAGGFQGSVTITNNGAALDGWTLGFDLPGDRKVTRGRGARWSQSGSRVTAGNETWNGSLGTGARTSVDAYVDGGRYDRRLQSGNWCTQAGAGLGERPQAAPAPGIDAYVWMKPPGESDGVGKLIPNNEGKGFDRMCDPTYTGNPRNNNHMSGALPDAPLSGQWFSAQFQELLKNAYPAL
ncbi:cellulose binding domain-containing protein [Streptomyces sp. CB01881]|uniref:cellulose binding domain-containing protein n=1 Tax=Streptomyces sp. CB01881 TaxID=2078691 RepID=UPI0023F775E5|nr:cellulose binding domain-containing protein [Streptomyces sp. CB01881]